MLNLDNIVSNKSMSSSEDNDWPFRMLFIGPSGSGKTNTLLHLINDLHPIDKIYLYAKDIHEPKYEYLINKREQVGIKNLNDPHAFIEYSDDMNDVLDDINDYNKNRDKKVLSGHLEYKDFLEIYNYCTREPYSFMTIDTRPTAIVIFKKNINEPIDLSEEH